MNYDMNMIKYRKNGFFRIASAILIICFTLFGLTACTGTTDSKDNNDDNALMQGTWEIDTGSGAGYKFVEDKFMWLKSIEDINDNYWYGDVEYYNGAEAMEMAGLTDDELQSSLSGLKPENIFVTKLDPEKIITDGEDKTATNMNDQTLWTRLWLIEENEDNVVAVVFDLETFSCTYNLLTKVPNIFNAKSDYVTGDIDFSYNQIDGFQDGDEHRGINSGSVNLGNNRLETFPTLLFKTESPIQTLILAGNGMKTIPKGALSGKTAQRFLTSLDLTHNKLSALTDDFYVVNMPVLYGLDLSYNCFSKFPTQPLSINYLVVFGISNQRDADGNRILREWPTGLYKNPSLKAFYIGSNDLRKIEDVISPAISLFEIKDNPNISIDISTVCPYIQAGQYQLIYDKTQDIRGCDALDLDK